MSRAHQARKVKGKEANNDVEGGEGQNRQDDDEAFTKRLQKELSAKVKDELKKDCIALGITSSGLKADLVARIVEFQVKSRQAQTQGQAREEEAEADAASQAKQDRDADTPAGSRNAEGIEKEKIHTTPRVLPSKVESSAASQHEEDTKSESSEAEKSGEDAEDTKLEDSNIFSGLSLFSKKAIKAGDRQAGGERKTLGSLLKKNLAGLLGDKEKKKKRQLATSLSTHLGGNVSSRRGEDLAETLTSKSKLIGIDKKLTVEKERMREKNRPDAETKREKDWFGMKNSPLDRDAKYTIALIANRHAIDPKRHYRKEERKPQNTPKLFQVGTVMSTSAEFYSSRLKRKEQRPNLAEEILSDERLNPYLKRKFSELQQDFKQKGRKALKKQQGQKTPKWKKQAGVKRSKKSR